MMRMMITVALLALAFPALAKVHETAGDGFVVRHQIVVPAAPDEVWARLIRPADWWSKAHSFSGDAANLTLVANAGGCFCEWLPDSNSPDNPPRGSVEHMRVINVERERVLRMTGALGPLQSEAVLGTLTIVLRKTDVGTGILWEYVVGGYMRRPVGELAGTVDALVGEQLNRLGSGLGGYPMLGEPSLFGSDADKKPDNASKKAEANDDDDFGALFEEALDDAPAEAVPDAEPKPRDAPFIGR